MRTVLIMSIIFTTLVTSFGQNSQVPLNTFKDFKLGMTIETLIKEHPELIKDPTNNFCCFSSYSEVKSDFMEKYWINEIELSSGDKVSVKLGIYKGKLALIIVAYKNYQVFDDMVNALQTKYGKYSDLKQNFYSDPLANMNKTDINVYWKNQYNTLNYCHTSSVGLDHLIYADNQVQKEIKSRISNENLKKIQ